MRLTKHVVIVGGGFGGLEAAKALAGAPVRVTLVDRSHRRLFQPLLYQVAMAGLSPAGIAAPIWFLIDFWNRVVVMFAWAWSYLTYPRGARLITGRRLHAGPRSRASGEHAPPSSVDASRVEQRQAS